MSFPVAQEIESTLLEFVAMDLLHGEEEIDLMTPLLALGIIDSLSMVSLLSFVQDRYHVAIPNDSITVEHFENVASISAMILERMESEPVVAHEEQTAMEQAVRVLTAAGVQSRRHELGDGLVLHTLEVEGDDPLPWILLPGLGNPASSWGNLLKAMAGEHSAVAIDLVGFGLSTGPEAPHYRDHVEVLDRFLEARFGDRPVVLVGSSAGCLMALERARRHPQSTHALVLVGFGLIEDPEGWMAELDTLWKQPEEFLARTFYSPPKLNALLLEQFETIYGMKAYHSYLRPADLAPSIFDGIGRPTLVVGGSDDRIIGFRAIRAAAERIPGASLVELARCGHFPGQERAEELVYTIRSFLEELPDHE
ncbi:MAG: alpha/beta fold hydrolase [Myxococcales bacterium]|nr:alpha/beta fold hydrolase [Myxococcales bacterium]MCB9716680.1 alpha/beta fold hydrolase [Myxococcales bacterium]